MTKPTVVLPLSLLIMAASAYAANVAVVNGKPITDDDLKTAVSSVPGAAKNEILKDPTLRSQLISNLVNQELVIQQAKAKRLDSTADYKAAVENFKRQLLIDALVKQQFASKVNESTEKDFFEKNKIHYNTDEVHAYHILVRTAAEAQAVLAEVKKPGVDFQSVAEKKSIDPTAKNNRGDIGFFARETLDPTFTDAAFTTPVGQITGPIRTMYGYHIIKVVDRKTGKTPEFYEIEPKVKADLQRKLLQDYVSQLRKKAKISLQ